MWRHKTITAFHRNYWTLLLLYSQLEFISLETIIADDKKIWMLKIVLFYTYSRIVSERSTISCVSLSLSKWSFKFELTEPHDLPMAFKISRTLDIIFPTPNHVFFQLLYRPQIVFQNMRCHCWSELPKFSDPILIKIDTFFEKK